MGTGLNSNSDEERSENNPPLPSSCCIRNGLVPNLRTNFGSLLWLQTTSLAGRWLIVCHWRTLGRQLRWILRVVGLVADDANHQAIQCRDRHLLKIHAIG